jgi:mono/diheme cytochrome c family protein
MNSIMTFRVNLHGLKQSAELPITCGSFGKRRTKSIAHVLSVAISGVLFAAMLAGRAMTSEARNVSPRSPAELYAKNCASCHGKDGRAKTFKGKLKHARDLTDPTWQANVSEERLFNSIMNGKGKMPAYSKKLSEQEIDSLVTYVRALKK